jgi:DNA helicase-2/ATP-dependent DNA helicase PcrA
VETLRTKLLEAASGSTADIVGAAASAWDVLDIRFGVRHWWKARNDFMTMSRASAVTPASEQFARGLLIGAARHHPAALLDQTPGGPVPVQVMNLYQPKGREADAIVVVFREGDFFGQEREPFRDHSRLLYVLLTRARQRVVVLLPAQPHALVRPLTRFAEGTGVRPTVFER